jgi:hypothetical protein
MKRFLVLTVLALGVTVLSQRPAAAWSNFRFSVGLNLGWQGGNNSYLCGLFRSGPAPAPWAVYPGGPGYPPPAANGFNPYFESPYAQGKAPAGMPGPASATAQTPPVAPPAPPATPSAPPQATATPFQPVGYFPSTSLYNPAAGSYRPAQAPSYWYRN